jgi:hypothetical protein
MFQEHEVVFDKWCINCGVFKGGQEISLLNKRVVAYVVEGRVPYLFGYTRCATNSELYCA